MSNPFTVGKPVAWERFVGRKAEIESAFDQMFSRSHCAVWGGAGMGKSSLLRLLATPEAWQMRGHNISEVAIATVSCLTLSPFSAASFWRKVLNEIKSKADSGSSLQLAVDRLLQKARNTSNDLAIALRELGKSNRFLVLLVDDYDVALRTHAQYSDADIETFLSECRSIATAEDGRLSTVVTSSRRLSDLSPKLTPDKSPWYNHYLFRQLKPLTDTEVSALFAGIPITLAIQEGIREMADGNPTLLQNAGYLLYEKMRSQEKLAAKTFAQDFQDATIQIFQASWDMSNTLEQTLMMLIALTELQGKLPNQQFDLSDIKIVFSQKEIELNILIGRGIIQRNVDGDTISYAFASSIMEWWVVKQILNSNDNELQDRQKGFLNLMSHKQANKVTESVRWLWQHRDQVPSIAKWAGKLITAFPPV